MALWTFLRRARVSAVSLPLIPLAAACGGTSGVNGLTSGASEDSGTPSVTRDAGPVGSGSGGSASDGAAPGDSGGASGPEAGSGEAGAGDGGGTGDQDAAPIAWVTDPASLVNTLVGTLGKGNTFPGADYPFGMVQWSPDTSPDRTPGGGYLNSDTSLIGFSLTHISGPGCAAYGDFPILPLTGGLPSGDPGSHLEPLSHAGEVGTAGYYTVQSGSPAITTELTATQHSGMARFTFPATTTSANLLIKLLASAEGSTASSATIVGTNEVQGSTSSGNFCGKGNKYTVYFDIVFDQPFTASIQNVSGGTMPSVVFLTFDTTTTQVVQAKAAVSFVSAANANGNWTAENPSTQWDFDAVKSSASTAWNGLLNQVQISGGTATDQQLFYTSLYHSLLHPNVFSDTNGEYIGFDNQTHTVSGSQQAQYANYSGWDIYRSQVQLSALVAPQQMSDAAQSIVNDATQNNGQLVKWAMANGETYEMIGDPSDGILAGYYAFGATGFDTATALADMMSEATTTNNVRPGLSYYTTLGYLPDDGTYGCCNFYGSVSTTLEYAQADFAISQFASALGTAPGAAADATAMLARAQNWQNLFNPTSGLFNPKLANGTFVSGIGLSGTQGMVEGSAAQYMWEEPFDRQALLAAMGGASVVNPMLESYFTQLNNCSYTAPYACLTNEQDIGEQYWNDFTGQPWATQNVVNTLRTQVFTDAPLFMNNNDDLGAESAMLVWSMLGVYPNYPGSAVLTINSPELPAALLHLPGGATLAINAPGASTSAPYVQSLLVNGVASTASWLDASLVKVGGTLDFTLGATPNLSWGTAATDAPPSYGAESTAAIGFVQPNPVVIPPGGQTGANIGAQSTRTDVAQTVSWKLSSSAGTQITVSPTSGQLTLTAGGQATMPLTFTGPQTQGAYTVPFELTSSLGVAIPPLVLDVFVAPAGSLSPYFNNTGISSDSAPTANFDGSAYSYSAQALAAAGITPGGTITSDGVTFTWPNVASGQPDNIAVGGQTITFSETAKKTTLGLLGSASSAAAAGATGTVTVSYADHTTQSIPIVFTDWTEGGGGGPLATGDVVAITTSYRDNSSGPAGTTTYVYAFTASLTDMTSTVTSVTLPSSVTGGTIHLFDVVLQ